MKSHSAATLLMCEPLAVRALQGSTAIKLMEIAISDRSALVRAAALRRLSVPAAKSVLLKALESDDPFVRQAARHGLKQSLKNGEVIASAGSKALSSLQRLGLLLILRESGQKEALALLPGFLSDPDPDVRFAAIQWVGEHRLTEFRPSLEAALASAAETRTLFEATLAAIERLDGKTRGLRDEVAGEEYVIALLKDVRTPVPILQHAIRMLRADHPAVTIDFLNHMLANASEPVKIEAVRILCQSSLAKRFDILAKLAEDQSASVAIRAEAIAGLADDATSQRERLLALASEEQPALRNEALRSLRGVSLTDDQRSKLRTACRGDAGALELVDFLTIGGEPARSQPVRNQTPATDIDAWLARLNGPADPAGGRAGVFSHEGPWLLSLPPVRRPRKPGRPRPHKSGRGHRPPPISRINRRTGQGNRTAVCRVQRGSH